MVDMNVVDSPIDLAALRNGEEPRDITLDDVNAAFEWAKAKGTLDQPLLFIFIDQGETAELCVKAGITEGGIKKVWAVILTPESANQRDEQGYSLIQSPVVYLSKSENSLWSGKFSEFYYNGDYKVTFMAEDQDGFIANSLPIVFTLSDGQNLSSGDTTQETSVQLNFNQSVYEGGDQFKLEIILNGNEIIDLYAAIFYPDNNFQTLIYPNNFSEINTITPYQTGIELSGEKTFNILDFTLPIGLPAGSYIGYAVAIETGSDLLNIENWIDSDSKKFEFK